MMGIVPTLLVATLWALATDAGYPRRLWYLRSLCEPIRCPPECHKVRDARGCLKCDCPPKGMLEEPKIRCSPPKCPPGCGIQKIFEGPCPGCDCDILDRDEEILIPKLCSPPKCPPGCVIQKIFEGPCPVCDCGHNFRNKDGFKGAFEPPKGMCSMPKCPPGCEIQKVFDGPCPGCNCHQGIKPGVEYDCPEHSLKPCPFNCESVIDEITGCKMCHCKKVCDQPKCSRFCNLKEGEDGCPACDCPRRGGWTKWKH